MQYEHCEIVDGCYEPRLGASIANAIVEAISLVKPGVEGTFRVDGAEVKFNHGSNPRVVWDEMISQHKKSFPEMPKG